MSYDRLLSPYQLNDRVTVKNRVIMAPMNNNFANQDGSVSSRYANYFIERAKGGVGMIIIAPGYVDRRARKRKGSLLLDDEIFIPKLKEFMEALHKEGTIVLQQLNHNGRLLSSSKELNTAKGICIGPSAVPHLLTGEIPQVMNKTDIEEMVQRFVVNAKNSMLAGYDGVEIHGAHGYLINQFLSRYSNKRDDEYGGSLENRMRFPLEIVRAIRKEVGSDFIMSFRLCAKEFKPDGVDLQEAKIFARELEKAGINLLNVSVGNTESPKTALIMMPPPSVSHGCYSNYSKEIKSVVNIPVSIMGRITTPERAEEILEATESDFVTIGRGLVSDPDFVAKVASGRRNEIRQCIGCLEGCYEELAKENPLGCIYNPFVGREGEKIEQTISRKKVWVIGGGPAGMEAARVAAMRGHDVTLFEATEKLGGQVKIAFVPPGKDDFRVIIKYYEHELTRLGVQIKLGEKVTKEAILKSSPEAVVLTVGASPLMLPLPGVEQENVITGWEVLEGTEVGEKVVVCGGGLVGIETALYLWKKGKKVEIIDRNERIIKDAGPLIRAHLLDELEQTDIQIHPKTSLLGIEGNKVLGEFEGKEVTFSADSIVLSLGAKSNLTLETEIKNSDYKGKVYTAGDCVKPRRILQATAEGAEVALLI
ncbi:FAD-dependent oxidoreductase [Bacillus timonensis]|uniref:FAD-dependent oxidoreductase n=1 Tax=Bacillus timonensis TaxID=1033734 RepID=A0A4S3PKD8_9BACI|nr:FAD-dependent oxidoreductase [Bacillus timonensis]THE09917.1 FAD-dependent oxidoreductase [Bacillus timonensis]